MWGKISDLFAGTYGGIVFGIVGMIVTGFFGWLSKRGILRRHIRNSEFKSTIDGYESLIKSQAARISYLELQESIRNTYEDELIRRLRAAELRNLNDSTR